VITCGIDLGVRKAAIALLDNGEVTNVGHLELPDAMDRATQLRTVAEWTIGYTKVAEQVFIEEPLVGRNTRVSMKIAQTAGAVMATLGTPFTARAYFVDNKTWKKAVVGNGNASKEKIAEWLSATYPAYATLCEGNQDRIDATCIGLYGALLHDRAQALAGL
jgi:Holliday junction resolvasome RuvABC endonuclease subunit